MKKKKGKKPVFNKIINKMKGKKMETNTKTISINGVEYIEKTNAVVAQEMDKENFIVRTYAAGVFYGQIEKKDLATRTVIMKNARRVWSWSGAASLSQLSVDGTSNPDSCKFPCAVESVELFQVEEILPLTAKAKKSLDGVKIWKQ